MKKYVVNINKEFSKLSFAMKSGICLMWPNAADLRREKDWIGNTINNTSIEVESSAQLSLELLSTNSLRYHFEKQEWIEKHQKKKKVQSRETFEIEKNFWYTNKWIASEISKEKNLSNKREMYNWVSCWRFLNESGRAVNEFNWSDLSKKKVMSFVFNWAYKDLIDVKSPNDSSNEDSLFEIAILLCGSYNIGFG